LKRWENAEDDVECVIDMVDKSVSVEFSNHIYNWELQEVWNSIKIWKENIYRTSSWSRPSSIRKVKEYYLTTIYLLQNPRR
jgi:hypothetical protein